MGLGDPGYCYTLEPEQPGSPNWAIHGADGGDSNAPASEPMLNPECLSPWMKAQCPG